MNWVQANRKSAIVVALTLALPLLVVLYVAVELWSLGSSYQDDIDRLEPRIARMLGVAQAEEELLATAAQADNTLKGLVYPVGEDPDAISASLQKNVRELMSGAGLAVVDSRIEPVRRENVFDVIGLAVNVTGGTDALDAALDNLATYSPMVLVTDITAQPARIPRGAKAAPAQQLLSVRMKLIALVGVE